MSQRDIIVGKVLKSHGLNGEMRILPFTANLTNFKNYKAFTLKNKAYPVTHFKLAGKYLIVKLTGIESIDEVKLLQGEFLTVARSEVLALQATAVLGDTDVSEAGESNTALIVDLIHLEVYAELTSVPEASHENLSEFRVGVIEGYYDAGAKGMLKIDLADEMLPFVVSGKKQIKNFFMPCDDEYLGKIELAKKRVWIKNLGKLLELKKEEDSE